MSTPLDAKFVTVEELAALLRVSRMTAYRMVHANQVQALRFGRSIRIPVSEVDRLLSEGGAA